MGVVVVGDWWVSLKILPPKERMVALVSKDDIVAVEGECFSWCFLFCLDKGGRSSSLFKLGEDGCIVGSELPSYRSYPAWNKSIFIAVDPA